MFTLKSQKEKQGQFSKKRRESNMPDSKNRTYSMYGYVPSHYIEKDVFIWQKLQSSVKYFRFHPQCGGFWSHCVLRSRYRKQQVASCELQVASWTDKQQVASYSLVNNKLQVETTSCKLVFTSWTNKQQVASWFLRVEQINNKLQVGLYELNK